MLNIPVSRTRSLRRHFTNILPLEKSCAVFSPLKVSALSVFALCFAKRAKTSSALYLVHYRRNTAPLSILEPFRQKNVEKKIAFNLSLFSLSCIKKKSAAIKQEEVDRFTKRFLLSIQYHEIISALIEELESPDIIDFDEKLHEEF